MINFILLFISLFNLINAQLLNDFYRNNKFMESHRCNCSLRQLNPRSLKSNIKEKIFNGFDATKDYTFIGVLYYEFYDTKHKKKYYYIPVCGGVLMNENFALTTGYCAELKNQISFDFFSKTAFPSDYRYGITGANKFEEIVMVKALNRKVKEVFLHPDYRQTESSQKEFVQFINNVALVLFEEPFDLDIKPYNIQLACISDEEIDIGNVVKITSGFGITSKNIDEFFFDVPNDQTTYETYLSATNKLQLAFLENEDKVNCRTDKYCLITQSVGFKKGSATCPNDGGNPLIVYEKKNDRYVILGVRRDNQLFLNDRVDSRFAKEGNLIELADESSQCTSTFSRSTFTAVNMHTNWIIKKIDEINKGLICMPPELKKRVRNKEYCKCENIEYLQQNKGDDDDKKRIKRIVNGMSVGKTKYHFIATIFTTVVEWTGLIWKDKHITYTNFCTGVILNRFYVLTSGHCIEFIQAKKFGIGKRDEDYSVFVAAGGENKVSTLFKTEPYRKYIKEFILHPNYKRNSDDMTYADNDIGLVHLLVPGFEFEYNVRFGDFQPACINLKKREDEWYPERLIFAGYGAIKKDYAPHQRGSQKQWWLATETYEIINQNAQPEYLSFAGGVQIRENPTCAAPFICIKTYGSQSGCLGDSGSPLISNINNKSQVIGILTAIEVYENRKDNRLELCEAGSSAKFLSLSGYLDWIKYQIGNDYCTA